MFPVTGDWILLPWLLELDGEWLGNYICQLSHYPGMHLIKSHGLVYIKIPKLFSNPDISKEEIDFINPSPGLTH